MNFDGTLQNAVALVKSGLVREAADAWRRTSDRITLRNRLLVLSEACHLLGKTQECLNLVQEALNLDPEDVPSLCAAGEAYQSYNIPNKAFECFFKATQLQPEGASAWSGLGYVFFKAKKLDEAASCLQKAFEINPSNPDISNRLGLVLLERRHYKNAAHWFLNSIKLKPDFSQAWSNLAVAWRNSDEIELAIRACKNAVKIEPASAANWTNLGVLYQEMNHIEEALFAYRKAIALDENFHLAHVNEGIALLLRGDLPQAWSKYEHRWFTSEHQNQRHTHLPLWRGDQSLRGKTILLHSDQGFGDTIQCLRFVPVLSRLGAIVHVEVNAVLVDLAQTVEGVVSAVPLHEASEIYDFQCPFLSIPFACQVDFENLPHAVPYLRPSAKAAEKWSPFSASPGKLKVAIAWRGNPKHDNDRNRSLSSKALKPLLELKNCDFFSLQWSMTEDEDRLVQSHPNFHNPMPRISSFDDTAAFLAHMDLVISVDTAVAHLAGALGREIWVLLPFAPDWRWMLGRTDSPWYPTARIFRQPKRGDWDSVVQAVAARLEHAPRTCKESPLG